MHKYVINKQKKTTNKEVHISYKFGSFFCFNYMHL